MLRRFSDLCRNSLFYSSRLQLLYGGAIAPLLHRDSDVRNRAVSTLFLLWNQASNPCDVTLLMSDSRNDSAKGPHDVYKAPTKATCVDVLDA